MFQSKVVKTIVESGATVQVTSQDNSDSDEDEGNVYNVKVSNYLKFFLLITHLFRLRQLLL